MAREFSDGFAELERATRWLQTEMATSHREVLRRHEGALRAAFGTPGHYFQGGIISRSEEAAMAQPERSFSILLELEKSGIAVSRVSRKLLQWHDGATITTVDLANVVNAMAGCRRRHGMVHDVRLSRLVAGRYTRMEILRDGKIIGRALLGGHDITATPKPEPLAPTKPEPTRSERRAATAQALAERIVTEAEKRTKDVKGDVDLRVPPTCELKACTTVGEVLVPSGMLLCVEHALDILAGLGADYLTEDADAEVHLVAASIVGREFEVTRAEWMPDEVSPQAMSDWVLPLVARTREASERRDEKWRVKQLAKAREREAGQRGQIVQTEEDIALWPDYRRGMVASNALLVADVASAGVFVGGFGMWPVLFLNLFLGAMILGRRVHQLGHVRGTTAHLEALRELHARQSAEYGERLQALMLAQAQVPPHVAYPELHAAPPALPGGEDDDEDDAR